MLVLGRVYIYIDMNPVNQHSHGKCPPFLMGPFTSQETFGDFGQSNDEFVQLVKLAPFDGISRSAKFQAFCGAFSCRKNQDFRGSSLIFEEKNSLEQKILSNNDFKISNVRWSSFSTTNQFLICSKLTSSHREIPKLLPSRVLTLQGTNIGGKSSSKLPLNENMLVPRRITVQSCVYNFFRNS